MTPDLRKYIEKHFRWKTLLPDGSSREETQRATEAPAPKSFRLSLLFLMGLSWLCGAGFILSFFLDFGPDVRITIAGLDISFENLLRIVSVSGLIGFGTNWLAIKMLFKPVVRRPVWGQGLIPAQRNRIIGQLAKGIHENILHEDMLRNRIHESGIITRLNHLLVDGSDNLLRDAEFRQEVKSFVHDYLKAYVTRQETKEKFAGVIDQKLEEKLNQGLKGFLFKAYRRMNRADYELMIENLVLDIPNAAIEAIEALEQRTDEFALYLQEKKAATEAIFSHFVMELLERLDIRGFLVRQMDHFDEAKLERLIYSSTNEQLQYIQYLGALLGILGGLLIWQPVPMLILYGTLFGILYLADVILFRLRQKQ